MHDNARHLLRFYQSLSPDDANAELTGFAPISDGWESEVYAFTLAGRGYILRIYPGDDAVAKSTREYTGMSTLHQMGYPVPEVLHHCTDLAWFGKPFVIMEKINGTSLRELMWSGTPERRTALFSRVMRLFVDLHALEFDPFLTPEQAQHDWDDPLVFIRLKLAEARAVLLGLFQLDDFAPALDWLEARMADVPCKRYSVTHNDFHDANVLVTPDDAMCVIDWTNIEVADFRYDLAWTMLLNATYGPPSMRERILDEYSRQRGEPVEQIDYFEAIAAVRRLFTIAAALGAGGETLGMRAESAAMIKQNTGHITGVYDVLKDRTGLRIPSVERLIDSL